MNILIACEYSGIVSEAFEAFGHHVVSCDLLPTERKNKDLHYRGNVLDIINNDFDLMIAFPPCTHLAVSGAGWFKNKAQQQIEALNFVSQLMEANIKHIAIENPVGIISTRIRKPDQIIQPYFFGNTAQKTTCLWLKNLPPLWHNAKPDLFNENITHVDKGDFYYYTAKKTGKLKRQPMSQVKAKSINGSRGKSRSYFWPGISYAMAKQWTEYIENL